jgi:D-aspartate ligase
VIRHTKRSQCIIPAVVLGMCPNALGVARSLGRRGVPVIAMANDPTSSLARSRYVKELWNYDGNTASMLDVAALKAAQLGTRPVLIPVTDAAVSAVATRKDELSCLFRIAMPNRETVCNALSKTGFQRMAEAFGLRVPRMLTVSCRQEAESALLTLRLPCILKPDLRSDEYRSASAVKAFLCGDKNAVVSAYEKFAGAAPNAIIQEYIPGGDDQLVFCFQYYNRFQQQVVSLTGRKIRQWPPSSGSASSCERIHCPEIEEVSREFFERIGYWGPCSMEFKRDSRDGSMWVIEPTIGRTDWNNSFAEANGVPIPYLLYCDLTDQAFPKCRLARWPRRWIRMSMDRKAALHYHSRGELSVLRWLWSIRPPLCGPVWAWDDPWPTLYGLSNRVRSRVAKATRQFDA